MAEFKRHTLDGVIEITPKRHGDDRGFFSETFNKKTLYENGIDLDFVQDNHSLSREIGVLRGLHFQTPPFAQDKLVRVTKGCIWDVAVDIRTDSQTYGQWVGVEISAKKWNQLLVPKGFAHGFVTLEADTEVVYKVTAPYSKDNDRTIRFDDPSIAVKWPLTLDALTLSDKDKNAPFLKDVETGF